MWCETKLPSHACKQIYHRYHCVELYSSHTHLDGYNGSHVHLDGYNGSHAHLNGYDGLRLLGKDDSPIQEWGNDVVDQEVNFRPTLLLKVFIHVQFTNNSTSQ